MNKPNRAIVFISEGTEEIEAVVTIDVLRRAQIDVLVVGVSDTKVQYHVCSRGVKIVPDAMMDHDVINFDSYNAVIVPGGALGAKTLSENDQVQRIVADFYAQGKIVATICAGSLAIKTANIQNKRGKKLKITGHPSVKSQLEKDFDFLSERIVVDDHLITAAGPGVSFEFAFEIVKKMIGQVPSSITEPMILNFTV
ncbi:hypothetical protein BB559_001458 [Furculomyces boomerangus]|uniref:D-lactate dehydratase n=2 Tax=Harpellales TaxID=61421 RepID=A0A2T9Z1U7_9FUNG|nr:hypothetical protein BB559_001458 [Furculomyces boomerangus]PWA01760.1 hypothetical protein BB558_002109 [Smittium angustum]PWA03104.1 hypothetical protein BB558_000726 [Smittium angustum]